MCPHDWHGNFFFCTSSPHPCIQNMGTSWPKLIGCLYVWVRCDYCAFRWIIREGVDYTSQPVSIDKTYWHAFGWLQFWYIFFSLLLSTLISVTNAAPLNYKCKALLLCQTKQAHHSHLGFPLPFKLNDSAGEKHRRWL